MGARPYIKKLIEHLKYDRNYSVIAIAFKKSSLKIPREDVEKIVINWPVENQLLRTLWEILILPLLMKKLKIDLLFCPGGVISNFMPKNIKSATMFRNMTPFDEEQTRKNTIFGLKKMRNIILKKVMLRSMQKADLVIFISQFARQVT